MEGRGLRGVVGRGDQRELDGRELDVTDRVHQAVATFRRVERAAFGYRVGRQHDEVRRARGRNLAKWRGVRRSGGGVSDRLCLGGERFGPGELPLQVRLEQEPMDLVSDRTLQHATTPPRGFGLAA